ncbi:MAG TPA: hypothetical protein VIK86_01065 [Candidatus Paceibacterota bacterium]
MQVEIKEYIVDYLNSKGKYFEYQIVGRSFGNSFEIVLYLSSEGYRKIRHNL